MNLRSAKICFLPLPLFFMQCAINHRSLSCRDNESVSALLVFPIYSKIDIIQSGDKRVRSESFSTKAENEIKNQLIKYIPSRINTKYLETDSTLEEKIVNANTKLIKTIKRSLSPNSVEVPDFFLQLLDSLGENYGLFIYQGGFTRTPENLKDQYIKRRTIAVATLGIYDTEPNSAYSVMIGVLVDKNRKGISMYKELYWRNKNPNDQDVIRSQVRDILLSYFAGFK